jgi:hypothetical protein
LRLTGRSLIEWTPESASPKSGEMAPSTSQNPGSARCQSGKASSL